MTRARALIAAVCAACACAHAPVRPGAPPSLIGRSFPLTDAPMRLAARGRVERVAAEVLFDVASPATVVTSGCFGQLPSVLGRVRVPRLAGGYEELVEVAVASAAVADVELGPLAVALRDEAGCSLRLGTDLLGGAAIALDPLQRTMSLRPPRTRADYVELASAADPRFEHFVFTLDREPRSDAPLLSVRLRQRDATLVGAFLLSTRASSSVLDEEAARSAGLAHGMDLLRGRSLPPGVRRSARAALAAYVVDALALGPDVELSHAVLKGERVAGAPAVIGVLGVDVWGRFEAQLDLSAGVLLLKRPRVEELASRARCGGLDEAACYGLSTTPRPRGFTATAGVWRELREGGRLHLDPISADGGVLHPECRIGLSFAPGDPGATTSHEFPWRQLERVMPACAETLAAARGARLALFEEGALPACPGTCAFVQHLASGRTLCECQTVLGTGEASEHRFIELYRRLLREPRSGPVSSPEREPSDPE